jgi:hypothetical protein
MPQPHKNQPDYIDVQNMLGAIGEAYKAVVVFRTTIRGDRVEVIARSFGAPYDETAPVEHVALVSFAVKQPKDMASTLFTLCWDIWCQYDGGGATAAKRGAPTTWQGRVEVPRRRRAQ